MRVDHIVLAGIAILALVGCDKKDAQPATSPSASTQPATTPTAPAGLVRARPAEAARVKTAAIVVEYSSEIPAYERVCNDLPFRASIRKALLEAGFTVVDGASSADIVVKVAPELNCSSHDNSPPHWTKAEVKGEVMLASNGKTLASAEFRGVADPTVIILSRDEYTSIEDAPWQAAFESSNFAEAVAQALDQIKKR